MARKAKNADSGESKVSTSVSVLINANQLNNLIKAGRSTAKQTAELTGSFREKIAYAKDKQCLHTKAFAHTRQMDKMEPEQLLEYWTHLLAYMDMAGIKERMDAVGTLGLDDGDAPAGADVGGRPANVESLAEKRKRRSAAAEGEGEGQGEPETAVH
jgi:hypothetical protein